MTPPSHSRKVTWHQIRDDLRAEITNRTYLPEQQLPSATALMARYSVARQTVQNAFNALVAEGLVYTRPGAGVFVRPLATVHRLARRRFVLRDELGYYFDEIAQGYRPIGKPTVTTGPAPDEIARRLRVEPGSDVVIRSRVLGQVEPEPQPLQIAVSYLPAWLAAELPVVAQAHTGPGGIYDRIEEHAGAALEWEETQGAVAASDHEATVLGVTLGGPLVRVIRTATLPDGRPVEVNVTVMDGNRFEVVAVLERHETAAWPPAPATETPRVTQPGKAE